MPFYQAMNLAFADRDFYYGDPYFEPAEARLRGLLSKEYAAQRRELISPSDGMIEDLKPGDPYEFQAGAAIRSTNWAAGAGPPVPPDADAEGVEGFQQAMQMSHREGFLAGTTSIQAAERRRLGRFSDPVRRLDSCLCRRQYRCRFEPAHAELCGWTKQTQSL